MATDPSKSLHLTFKVDRKQFFISPAPISILPQGTVVLHYGCTYTFSSINSLILNNVYVGVGLGWAASGTELNHGSFIQLNMRWSQQTGPSHTNCRINPLQPLRFIPAKANKYDLRPAKIPRTSNTPQLKWEHQRSWQGHGESPVAIRKVESREKRSIPSCGSFQTNKQPQVHRCWCQSDH